MDPTSSKVSNTGEEEEWDADGFEIPSLNTGKPVPSRRERLESEVSVRPTFEKGKLKPETIYLGPHGAPPKQQDTSNPSNRKQRLKQKLKDAEKKRTILGRENKVEVLRDLMGGNSVSSPTASSEGWLEPYCHENQFERLVEKPIQTNWCDYSHHQPGHRKVLLEDSFSKFESFRHCCEHTLIF